MPFRLVVLDDVKSQLENPVAQKVLGDVLFIKQQNFLRTDPHYVVMDKHDMIGTHYLIYDTTNFTNPKLVFAIRTTFEDRAKTHKLKTPLMDLMPNLDDQSQLAFEKFRKTRPVIADCNAWFVDPEYSKKTAGLNLADLGYTMVYLQLRRKGLDHFVGCANEKYKASRWLHNMGEFPKTFHFIHPMVPDPHLLILLSDFKHDFFKSVYLQHKNLFDGLYEILPQTQTDSLKTVIKSWEGSEDHHQLNKVG